VAVRDEGSGIAAGDRDRVFDRFWRGGEEARAGSRTGRGLAIVRQITESHGGAVALHSAEGAGSTFVLWVPGAPGSGSPRSATAPAAAPLTTIGSVS
jgi:signal transduction histidine kinase